MERVYDVLSLDGRALEKFKEFQNDPTAVLTAVKEHAGAFVYASEALKHDESFVMHAIYENPRVLFYAKAFQGNKDVVMFAVEKDGDVLRSASDELKHDRTVVMNAVRHSKQGYALWCSAFRDDREVVMASVASCGTSLQWASKELRDDKEVVMMAVRKDGKALQWASDEMRDDKDVVMEAVANDGDALQWTYKRLKSDREVAMAAVMNYGPAFRWTAHVLKQDRDLALTAIKHGCPLRDVSSDLQDPELLAFARENERLNPTQEKNAVDFLREIKRQHNTFVTTLKATPRLNATGYYHGKKIKQMMQHFAGIDKDLVALSKRGGRRTNRTSRVYK